MAPSFFSNRDVIQIQIAIWSMALISAHFSYDQRA